MSLKERIELAKEQLGISEVDTQALEKALGKKLVDYESVEALVAALMGYYNGELKKKANTSHTHDYAPSSHKHKKANISDFPTSMKNPYALSIQLNSGTAYTYDGAATKNINITPASIGAADSSHTHTKANITDFPTSMKNPNALEIKMNGQNPVSYDGAAAKSINITASGIGAEPAFKKNGAFNKNFGTTSNTVLEGAKLAEILGLTYGGSLNTSSAKTVNYAYYDSTTKKVYKCIKATSINYADANYFEAISNNDLLGKLQNFNQDFKILYNGVCNKITTLTLPSSWRELYILHSGDNTFSNYAFPFVINRISLEVSKKITFYELWGGDSNDWGNLLYDVNLKTLKLASQNASDNLIVISYR